jgi:hypothetical protein
MIRRICFIYLCLYSIPAILLGTLPAPSPLAELYEKPWQGNDCLQVACYAVIAAVTAVVWRRMDERWPRTYLRYALALTLFGYGMAKVIPQQFPFPPLERMVTPFGESSPRGLLWTFMGYSRAYSVFAGASELLAGLLLCFRRTATLGALLAAGLLANVALINFGYDVQLKVFSLHQLFIAVLLLLPEVRRLADFFLLGKPVAAAEAVPASRLGLALKTLLIGYALISSAIYAQAAVKRRSARPALYGIYQVDERSAGSWARVIIDSPSAFIVQAMDGSFRRYQLQYDAGRLAVTSATEKHELAWEQLPDEHSILKGIFDGAPLVVKLHRVDRQMPLLRSAP